MFIVLVLLRLGDLHQWLHTESGIEEVNQYLVAVASEGRGELYVHVPKSNVECKLITEACVMVSTCTCTVPVLYTGYNILYRVKPLFI